MFTAAAVIAGVALGAWAWAAWHGFFFQDDFVIIHRAARASPTDPGYLFQDYQGHLAPGVFLSAWALTAAWPLNHLAAATPVWLALAASVVAWWLFLIRVFGARWPVLIPFTVYTASTAVMVPTLWWAYGTQLAPVLLAMTGALVCLEIHLRRGSRWAAAGTVLWTVFGLAFYEKAALIPLVLIAATSLLGHRVRDHLRLWAAHAVVLIGYALAFLSLVTPRSNLSGITWRSVGGLIRRMLVDTLLPSLFGGPWTPAGGGVSWSPPPVAVRIVCAVLLVAVIAWSVRRGGGRAVAVWLLTGAYLLIDVLVVTLTRLGQIGAVAGADPRYTADAVLIIALGGAFAFLGSGSPSPPTGTRRAFTRGPFPVLVVCAVLTAGFAVSFGRLAPTMRFERARAYVDNVRLAAAREPLNIYDAPVPRGIVLDWFGEDSHASRVVGLVPGVVVNDPGARMSVLDQSGRPRRITDVVPAALGARGPVPDCGYAVRETPVSIPLDHPVFGPTLLRLDHYSAGGGQGVIDWGGGRRDVYFPPGAHTLFVPITGLTDRVTVSLAASGSALCVPFVSVGPPTTGP